MSDKSDLLVELKNRCCLYQITDEAALTAILDSQSIACYIGFDCTAESLHVGSLMQIMIMRRMQKYGHKPIFLVGGGTTKIGDPSFKDNARPMLDDSVIKKNKQGIIDNLKAFCTFDGDSKAILVDNNDWLNDIKYLDFLRDYGKFFSINRMIGMESVKARLEREQNLTFLEFNYMLLQAYDFIELNRRYDCILQFGGSDQWGNIVTGVDLGRRFNMELFGITTPLITTSSGVKMGKTVKGAVWLNSNMLSPYEYWQFWRNTEDGDVERFLKIYTDIDLPEIAKISSLKGHEINEAKKILAHEATALCHGFDAALDASKTAQKIFEDGCNAAEGLPRITVTESELKTMSFFKLLVKSGLCSSGAEARRLINAHGARINDEVIEDDVMLTTKSMFNKNELRISCGKKKHVIVALYQG